MVVRNKAIDQPRIRARGERLQERVASSPEPTPKKFPVLEEPGYVSIQFKKYTLY